MGQRRIPARETLEVEFKSDLKRLPDAELIDTVVALSNTNGGELYVGVEDDGTPTGILLAGKQSVIQRVMPTSQAAFQVLQGTEVRVNQDLDGPLLHTIDKMREMLEPWNPEREFEDGQGALAALAARARRAQKAAEAHRGGSFRTAPLHRCCGEGDSGIARRSWAYRGPRKLDGKDIHAQREGL